MGQKFTITESERNQIRGLYEQLSTPEPLIGQYNDDHGSFGGKLQYTKTTNGYEYNWIYSNWEKSKRGNKYGIKFKGDPKLIEQLYNILISQCKKPHKTEYSFNLGDKTLNLFTTENSQSVGNGLLIEIDDTYFAITQQQINQLFGK